MKKVLLFAIMAMVIAIFAAGCNGSAPRENKMAIFRCVSENYYKNAGFYEISVEELVQLVENSEDDVDCFVYDSLNTYWVKLYRDSLNQTDKFNRSFNSNWPNGQKYSLIFYPRNNGDISKITFLFNAEDGIDATLFDCSLSVGDYEFWMCSNDIKRIENALCMPLYAELDGPMMSCDTALMIELGLLE